MSERSSAILKASWPARRQKMASARYACPRCQTWFTFQCLVDGPRVPMHAVPKSTVSCSGVGELLVRAVR